MIEAIFRVELRDCPHWPAGVVLGIYPLSSLNTEFNGGELVSFLCVRGKSQKYTFAQMSTWRLKKRFPLLKIMPAQELSRRIEAMCVGENRQRNPFFDLSPHVIGKEAVVLPPRFRPEDSIDVDALAEDLPQDLLRKFDQMVDRVEEMPPDEVLKKLSGKLISIPRIG